MIEATLIDHMGTDLSVANAARVSFGKKKETFDDKDAKLIRYLASHRHVSPFGHCSASFHCRAPVYVARQLVKHKFLRWNEVSRRYVDDPPSLLLPSELRGRPDGVKQGSTKEGLADSDRLIELMRARQKDTLDLYEYLLEEGVAPEQARMVLPQNMETEWYWSGSLDAFADMYNLRSKEDAQYEARLVAQQIGTEMGNLFPVSWKELTNGR